MPLKPRERILQAAALLFYRDGYRNTGVREILAESGAHKASFYRHFPAKEDLVRAYLEYRGDVLAEALHGMAARAADASRFFRLWQSYLYRAAKAGELHGCPLANLNAELGAERRNFRDAMTAVGDRWHGIIRDFLRREQRARRIPRRVDVENASRLVMMIYEGHLQAFSLYGDASLLQTMAADMSRALT